MTELEYGLPKGDARENPSSRGDPLHHVTPTGMSYLFHYTEQPITSTGWVFHFFFAKLRHWLISIFFKVVDSSILLRP